MGAGTGFLSLLLATQGYEVTAADFAPGMLARLRAKAADLGLDIKTVQTDATRPPAGGFDAVVERHLVWTLPDPGPPRVCWRLRKLERMEPCQTPGIRPKCVSVRSRW